MQWNAAGLQEFTKNHLYPAFRDAGISTKVLVHDWNWDGYQQWAAPLLNDPAIATTHSSAESPGTATAET